MIIVVKTVHVPMRIFCPVVLASSGHPSWIKMLKKFQKLFWRLPQLLTRLIKKWASTNSSSSPIMVSHKTYLPQQTSTPTGVYPEQMSASNGVYPEQNQISSRYVDAHWCLGSFRMDIFWCICLFQVDTIWFWGLFLVNTILTEIFRNDIFQGWKFI